MKTVGLTRAQRAQIVSEISLTYLGGGDRVDVVCRMERWLAKVGAPQRYYPDEKEMDRLVKSGKSKCREARAGFRQGAAEFARAVCR